MQLKYNRQPKIEYAAKNFTANSFGYCYFYCNNFLNRKIQFPSQKKNLKLMLQ